MYVVELTYPGTWIDPENKDLAWHVQTMLMLLEQQLTEAAVSLNLFEAERKQPRSAPHEQKPDQESELRQKLMAGYEQELGHERFYQNYLAVCQRVDRDLRRKKWESGDIPQNYKHSFIFIYAKSFLYSLDGIGKILIVLSGTGGIPTS